MRLRDLIEDQIGKSPYQVRPDPFLELQAQEEEEERQKAAAEQERLAGAGNPTTLPPNPAPQPATVAAQRGPATATLIAAPGIKAIGGASVTSY